MKVDMQMESPFDSPTVPACRGAADALLLWEQQALLYTCTLCLRVCLTPAPFAYGFAPSDQDFTFCAEDAYPLQGGSLLSIICTLPSRVLCMGCVSLAKACVPSAVYLPGI